MTTIRYRYTVVSALCLMAVLVAAATAAGTPVTGGASLSVTGGTQKYTMDQTLSDRGQEATIAFDALAFVTGDACSDTFLPPGKVAVLKLLRNQREVVVQVKVGKRPKPKPQE